MTKRSYICKYGCGFKRSRKAVVEVHEDDCTFGIMDRFKEYMVTNDKTIAELQTKIATLEMKLKERATKDKFDNLHDIHWKIDYRLLESNNVLIKQVFDSAQYQSQLIEKLTELWLKNCKPFFQLAPRSNNYIFIKGVPGRVNKVETGIPNKVTKITMRTFYDTIMPELTFVMEAIMERKMEDADLDQVSKTLQSHKYEMCDDPTDEHFQKKRNEYIATRKLLLPKIVQFMRANTYSEITI